MSTTPDCLDALIKEPDLALPTPSAPWLRVDFDQQGRPVQGRFVRRHSSMLVHPRARVECVFEFRVPSTGSLSIRLGAQLRLSCPLHSETEVARRFFDQELTPRQMFEKYIEQAVDEYIASTIRDRFLERAEYHITRLRELFAPRLALLTRLSVEVIEWNILDTPTPTPIRLIAHPVDLMDSTTVPIDLSTTLNVDQLDRARYGRALLMAKRQGELTELATAWIRDFFMTVRFADLFDDAGGVEERLRIWLASRAAEWGRIVAQLSMSWSHGSQVKPVDATFACGLADGTSVTVTAEGSLWLMGTTSSDNGHAAPADEAAAWSRLSEFLQARARLFLSPCRYLKLEPVREATSKKIATAAQDDARRVGVGAQLSLRLEWSHEWLRRGHSFSALVESTVGRETNPAKVQVWFDTAIDDRPDAPWRRLDRAALNARLDTEVTRVVREHVATSTLESYVEFNALQQTICEAITRQVGIDPGLAASNVAVNRADDWNRSIVISLMEHAPTLIVKHPAKESIQFEVQYRCIGSDVQSGGSPFPIYPTAIKELSDCVDGSIRDFLSRLPVAAAIGSTNLSTLRERAETEVPRQVSMRYFVRIQILRWIALPNPEVKVFEQALRKLLDERWSTTGRDFVRPDWKRDVEKMITCVEQLGGHVPWTELSLYDFEPKKLGPGPQDTMKGTLAGGDAPPG